MLLQASGTKNLRTATVQHFEGDSYRNGIISSTHKLRQGEKRDRDKERGRERNFVIETCEGDDYRYPFEYA